MIAGLWIWEVKSKDEALEWLARAPFEGVEQVEIRQLYSADDFPPPALERPRETG